MAYLSLSPAFPHRDAGIAHTLDGCAPLFALMNSRPSLLGPPRSPRLTVAGTAPTLAHPVAHRHPCAPRMFATGDTSTIATMLARKRRPQGLRRSE